jgi:hypothetical protein
MGTTSRLAAAALCGLVALGSAAVPRARAGQGEASLAAALEEVAKDVSKECRLHKITRLTGPVVNGPPGRPAGGLDRIEVLLAEKLKKEKLTLGATGQAEIRVEARVTTELTDDLGTKRLALRLKVQILRDDDKTLPLDKPYVIHGVSLALEVGGGTGNVQAKTVSGVERKAIAVITGKPRVTVDGNAVMDGPDKTFGVEVHLAQGNKTSPVVPKAKDGLAFVGLPNKSRYVVRLVNNSSREVAVELHIDGINVFAPPGRAASAVTMFVVGPKKTQEVPGWYLEKEKGFRAFGVGSPHPSDPRRGAPLRRKLRTITATFRSCWKKGDLRPEDEPAKELDSAIEPEHGTLVGPRVPGAVRSVEREFGHVRAAVTVRYEVPR